MWFMLNTYFPPGSLNFCYISVWGNIYQPPNKNPESWVQKASLVDNISCMLSQLVAKEIRYALCDSIRKRHLNTCTSSKLCLRALGWFALHAVAKINHSSKCDYMRSPVSPSKSVNLGVVLGPPQHIY